MENPNFPSENFIIQLNEEYYRQATDFPSFMDLLGSYFNGHFSQETRDNMSIPLRLVKATSSLTRSRPHQNSLLNL